MDALPTLSPQPVMPPGAPAEGDPHGAGFAALLAGLVAPAGSKPPMPGLPVGPMLALPAAPAEVAVAAPEQAVSTPMLPLSVPGMPLEEVAPEPTEAAPERAETAPDVDEPAKGDSAAILVAEAPVVIAAPPLSAAVAAGRPSPAPITGPPVSPDASVVAIAPEPKTPVDPADALPSAAEHGASPAPDSVPPTIATPGARGAQPPPAANAASPMPAATPHAGIVAAAPPTIPNVTALPPADPSPASPPPEPGGATAPIVAGARPDGMTAPVAPPSPPAPTARVTAATGVASGGEATPFGSPPLAQPATASPTVPLPPMAKEGEAAAPSLPLALVPAMPETERLRAAAAQDPAPSAEPTTAAWQPPAPPPPADVSAAPAPAPARATAPVAWPARQVAPFVVALALGPDSRLELTLEPGELGRVEVAIERSGGEALVSLRAERPETLALLQRDRAELERALSDAGLGGEGRGASLSFGPGGEGSARRERRETRHQPPAAPQRDLVAATPAGGVPRGLIDLAL